MVEFEIRVLEPRDASAFWALRLRGLQEAPEAFGSTYEEDAALSVEAVAERLKSAQWPAHRVTVGVFAGDALVGVAACVQEAHRKARHKATIYGMYVAPEARGRGAGRALLARVVAEARAWGDIERLTLTVVERAHAARRLYESKGFKEFGREADSLRQDGVRDTVLYLARDLD